MSAPNRRCSHRNGECLHRPQQATRFDEMPRFSWREVGEIVLGALVLSAAFVIIFVYGAAMAVGQ